MPCENEENAKRAENSRLIVFGYVDGAVLRLREEKKVKYMGDSMEMGISDVHISLHAYYTAIERYLKL